MNLARENANEWHARPSSPGERLRVAVLCSDDPHHEYLVSRIARELNLVGVVVEPGAAQQRRLWARRAWLDAVARAYQVRRQRYTGRSAYRRRYFAPLTAGKPGRRTGCGTSTGSTRCRPGRIWKTSGRT